MRFPVVLGIAVLGGAVTTVMGSPTVGRPARKSSTGQTRSHALNLIELHSVADLLEPRGTMPRRLTCSAGCRVVLELEAMSPTQLVEATEIAMSVDSEAQEREWAREKARNKGRSKPLKTVEEFEKALPQINREREEARKRDVDDTIKKKVSSAGAYLGPKEG